MLSIRSAILVLLSLFTAFIVYYPSFSVPFYLDDFDSIVNSPVIASLSLSEISSVFPMREVGYFSFSLNHVLWGDDPLSFHAVNFGIHILVSICVGWFASLLVTAEKRENENVVVNSSAIAFVAFTTFLLLALNTQAVTYIVQRLASLATLFYVVSLCCYLSARVSNNHLKSNLWFLASFVFFVLGMYTKQNVATLPISILVLECLILRKSLQKSVLPILTTGFLTFLSIQLIDQMFSLGLLERVDSLTREADRISRWDYFTHQLTALWIYAYKAFFPYPLLLEYGSTPFTWKDSATWLSLGAHIALVSVALKVRRRLPLVSALILMYYVAHAVESSFLPISDLMFEHRAYLPNVFLVALFSFLVYVVSKKYRSLVCLLLLVFWAGQGYATYQRNMQWQAPEAFYKHELTYVGDNSRSYVAVALLFAEEEKFRLSQRWFQIALKVGEETGHLQAKTITLAIATMFQNGNLGEASRLAVLGLKAIKLPKDRAEILVMLAKVKAAQGQCDFSSTLR